MNRPLVSVIIPTYNRAAMLCDCVRSVLKSDYSPLEVVVADDCSPDDTRAVIARCFKNDTHVKYTTTSHNSLTSGARNQGVRAASGDYYLFLDDDNILEPNCITELLHVFERHPRAAFVAPLTIHGAAGNDRAIWTTGEYFNPWTSRTYAPNGSGLKLNSLPPGLEWPTSYSPNAFMVTKHAFETVNGFDEGFGMQFDEADFGVRVTDRFGEGWVASLARTNHLGYLEPGKVSMLRGLGIERPRRAYVFGRNRLKFARRHFKWYQSLVVMFLFAPATAGYYLLRSLQCKGLKSGMAYLVGTLAGTLGIYRTIGFSKNKAIT